MGLRSLNLKTYYDPVLSERGLEEEFYVPCLEKSISYSRVSAYFTAGVLKKLSNGLASFWKNGGKARFVFSEEVTESELREIESGYRERAMKGLSNALSEQERFLIDDENVANLSYLISIGAVEVKICFMFGSGILHMKMGVFEDAEGEIVAFSGSGNETVSGLENNSEQFHVFTSFQGLPTDSGRANAQEARSQFERIWKNEYSPKCLSLPPEGELYERLVSYSKGRLFKDRNDFLTAIGKVCVDIDKATKRIIINDYDPKKPISRPWGLSSRFGGEWREASPDCYWVDLSVHNLRDLILNDYFKPFGIQYILSEKAQRYLIDQDLKIDKRLKLGLAIKNGTERDLWGEAYSRFKTIVDENTNPERHLKDRQMLNAFHHMAMECSADFSVPGTGKTYIAYGMYAYLSDERVKKARRLVVFGPIASFRAWKLEGQAIFSKKRRLNFFDSSEAGGNWRGEIYNPKYDVILVNYEKLDNRNEVGFLADGLLNEETMIVFDEEHRVKGRDSKRALNLLDVLSKSKGRPIYRLCLTGTPMPNSFVDLYNLIRILYPDDLNSFPIERDSQRLRMADSHPSEAEKVQKELAPIFMRTTKEDLSVPLPEPDDLDSLAVIPSDKERALYHLIWETSEDVFSAYIRLIEAASNPRLLKKKITVGSFDDAKENETGLDDDFAVEAASQSVISLAEEIGMASKTKRAIKKIAELASEGKRVLVWCLFLDTIDLLMDEIRGLGVPAVKITGGDPPNIRNEKINVFQSGKAQVLITNPNTLAESVSLHRECHDAIYLEYGFNLTYMLQSKDRINRVGLPPETKTHYYFAVARSDASLFGPIDERILARLKTKERRMNDAMKANPLSIIEIEKDIDVIKEIIGKTFAA